MATTTINVTAQAYDTIKDESTALTQRSTLKFTGDGVSAADSGGETVVTIAGPSATTNVGLFAQTANSPTLTATTTEGTLIDGGVGSLSVPANGFKVGDSFRVEMGGIMSAQNGNTLTIRLKSGSVNLGNSGPLTMPGITNQVFMLSVTFTIRAIELNKVSLGTQSTTQHLILPLAIRWISQLNGAQPMLTIQFTLTSLR